MKSLIKLLAALVAASAVLAACQTAPVETIEMNALIKTVDFTAGEMETRTTFTAPDGDKYPVVWTSNDKEVAIFPNDLSNLQSALVEPSSDGRTARFRAAFALGTASDYQFFFVSPASAMESPGSGTQFSVTVPSDQSPSALSPDESAQILYAKSSKFDTVPDAVTFNPSHLTAYLKLTLTNVDPALGDIGYVRITSTELIAGTAKLCLDPMTLTLDAETGSKSVTAYVDNCTDVWFGLFPSLVNKTKLTVTVSGNKGSAEREVTLPDKTLFPGKVAILTVDMKTATPSDPPSPGNTYDRISEARFVTEGTQFIVATAADDLSWGMSATQSSDYRAGVAVTKSRTRAGEEEFIIDPSDEVEVLTVEAGTTDDRVAFKTKDGKYLAIDKNKNSALLSADAKSTLSDWRVRYNDGECEIRNNATNNIYYLRYRKSDNRFLAVRSSFVGNLEPLALFKRNGTGGSDWKLPPELRLAKTSLTLTQGETRPVVVALCYSLDDGAEITYSTSDASVATVSDKGVVTALKAGEATITVSSSETDNYQAGTATCQITVVPPVPIQSISISPEKLAIFEGETGKLTLVVTPSNAYYTDVEWSVLAPGDKQYLSVDNQGNVTGLKAMNYYTTINVSVRDSDNKLWTTSGLVAVITPYAVESFSLSPDKLTLKVGESKPVSLVVNPSDAVILETKYVSEDETVATFNNGVVKAVGPGETFVEATIKTNDGRYSSAFCHVIVARPVESVEVSPSTLTLTPGGTAKLTATVKPSNADDQEVIWSSSDATVASVSSDGTVTAHKKGTAVITATSAGYSQVKGTCAVTVGLAPSLKVQYAWSSSETATWTDYVDPVEMSSTYQACYFRLYDSANQKVIKSGQFSRYHTSYPNYFSSKVEVYGGYMWRIVLETNGYLEETLTCKDEEQGIDFEQRVIVYIPRPLALSLDSDRSTIFTSGGTVPVRNGSTRTLYIRHKDERRDQVVEKQLLFITGGDTSIATIEADETRTSTLTITAKRQGTTTFRILYGHYGVTLDTYVKVNVVGPVTKVTINQKSDAAYYYDDKLNIDKGDVLQMSATVEGGIGQGVTWSLMTSADAISVNETTGRIQGVKYGDAYLKATSVENPSVYDYVYVHVWEPATEIRIGQAVRVKPGYTEKLYYVVEPSLYANQRIEFETPGYYAPQVQKWTIGSTVTESSGWRTITLTPPASEAYNAGNVDNETNSRYATFVKTKNGKIRKEVPLAVVQYYKTDTKPMDYIVRTKDNTHSLRSMDGGLRIVADKFNRALKDETAINIANSEEVIAVIHKINTGDYSYGNSYMVVNGKLSNAPNARGVAVAITDTGNKVKWSSDSDDVPNAEDWPSGQAKYPSCQVTSVNSSQQNGVALSASAFYYNYKRGSSHDIQPEEQIRTYQTNHTVYDFMHPMLTINNPTVPGWFVPTIAEWLDLKCYTSGVHDGIIDNIKKAGGSFDKSRDYWLIECYDKTYAWYATYLNGAYHDKKKSAQDCYVRPFLRF